MCCVDSSSRADSILSEMVDSSGPAPPALISLLCSPPPLSHYHSVLTGILHSCCDLSPLTSAWTFELMLRNSCMRMPILKTLLVIRCCHQEIPHCIETNGKICPKKKRFLDLTANLQYITHLTRTHSVYTEMFFSPTNQIYMSNHTTYRSNQMIVTFRS